MQAALQVFIDPQQAQHLGIFSAWLYPHYIVGLGRRQRLRRSHVLHLNIDSGVAVAIVIGNYFAHCCRGCAGIGQPVFASPCRNCEQKTENYNQSNTWLHALPPAVNLVIKMRDYKRMLSGLLLKSRAQRGIAIVKLILDLLRGPMNKTSISGQRCSCDRNFRRAEMLAAIEISRYARNSQRPDSQRPEMLVVIGLPRCRSECCVRTIPGTSKNS